MVSKEIFLSLNFNTTGPDPDKDIILEVAAMLVRMDGPFSVTGRPFHEYISHQALSLFEKNRRMDKDFHEKHLDSGLIDDISGHSEHVTLAGLDSALCHWLVECSEAEPGVGHKPGNVTLCGEHNVPSMLFVLRQLPNFSGFLSDRSWSVRAFIRMYETWCGEFPARFEAHRAVDKCERDLETLQKIASFMRCGFAAQAAEHALHVQQRDSAEKGVQISAPGLKEQGKRSSVFEALRHLGAEHG